MPFLAPLTGLLNLGPSGVSLIAQHFGPSLFGLLLVNEFHQDTLVLEHITLGLQVQLVVQVTVDLLGLTVTFEESPQHSHPLHPHLFLRHSSILSTFPLTITGVTALRRASVLSRTRDLECTATGFLITRPSLISLRIFCLELALAISLISLGSSQTLFLPHFMTEAAKRFCSFNELILKK